MKFEIVFVILFPRRYRMKSNCTCTEYLSSIGRLMNIVSALDSALSRKDRDRRDDRK